MSGWTLAPAQLRSETGGRCGRDIAAWFAVHRAAALTRVVPFRHEDTTFMSDNRPLVPVAAAELDRLLDTLMVEFVRLSECLVGEGFRLELGGIDAPGLHYNVSGTGRMVVGDREPIELQPHTLIILPANTLFRIEVPSRRGPRAGWKTVNGRSQTFPHGAVRRYV